MPEPSLSALQDPARRIAEWREQILHVTLVATAVLGGVAYVPGAMAAIQAEVWSLFVTDSVGWGLVIVMALGRRRISYRTRALVFLGLWLALSLHLLVAVGPVGGGIAWLLGFPVAGSILLGSRGSAVSLCLTLLGVVGMGIWIRTDVPGPWGTPSELGYQFTAWLATGASTLFLAAVLALSIAFLVGILERRLVETVEARRRTAQARARLEKEIEDRKRLQDQLIQSRKMEALGTLAGGIAHDFNNLLVPILMEAQEVRDSLPEGTPAREGLDDVVQSAVRARDLVRRILAFSRKTDTVRGPVQVASVVGEAARLLRGSIPAHVQLRIDVVAEDAWILADPGELNQILMNLATNGYLAMKSGGGTLTLGVHREDGTGPDEHPAPEPRERRVVVRVQDTGEGMPPEVRARAFDPFFTTREPGEGTGLGLATVHGLVTNLGGTLSLESTPGEGTTVEVRFLEVDPPRPEPPRTTEHAADALRILLVDDEPMVRRTTRALVQRLGHDVTEADGPRAALEHLRKEAREFDVVLTDQSMPEMTGTELAVQLKELQQDVPVILVSGFLDDEARRRARSAGVAAFLEKPYDRSGLAETLARVVQETEGDAATGDGGTRGAGQGRESADRPAAGQSNEPRTTAGGTPGS